MSHGIGIFSVKGTMFKSRIIFFTTAITTLFLLQDFEFLS